MQIVTGLPRELFGDDDHEVTRAVRLRDWRRFTEQAAYAPDAVAYVLREGCDRAFCARSVDAAIDVLHAPRRGRQRPRPAPG